MSDKVLVIEVEKDPATMRYGARCQAALDHFTCVVGWCPLGEGDGWRWSLREPSASEAPAALDPARFRGLLDDLRAAAFQEGQAQAQVDEAREVAKDTLAALERLLGTEALGATPALGPTEIRL